MASGDLHVPWPAENPRPDYHAGGTGARQGALVFPIFQTVESADMNRATVSKVLRPLVRRYGYPYRNLN